MAGHCATTDTSALTAVSNDLGYEQVFARQVLGLAQPGDVLIAISTSGKSKNVLRAAEQARELGCKTIALTGDLPNRSRHSATLLWQYLQQNFKSAGGAHHHRPSCARWSIMTREQLLWYYIYKLDTSNRH